MLMARSSLLGLEKTRRAEHPAGHPFEQFGLGRDRIAEVGIASRWTAARPIASLPFMRTRPALHRRPRDRFVAKKISISSARSSSRSLLSTTARGGPDGEHGIGTERPGAARRSSCSLPRPRCNSTGWYPRIRCKGCELCVSACPKDVLGWIAARAMRSSDTTRRVDRGRELHELRLLGPRLSRCVSPSGRPAGLVREERTGDRTARIESSRDKPVPRPR